MFLMHAAAKILDSILLGVVALNGNQYAPISWEFMLASI